MLFTDKFLLQPVTDDGYGETHAFEAVGMVQLEFWGLDVKLVIPAGDNGRNREAAVGGQVRDLALPASGQHVADLADGVLDGIVNLLNSMPVMCAAIFLAAVLPERKTQAPLSSPPKPTTAVTDSGSSVLGEESRRQLIPSIV